MIIINLILISFLNSINVGRFNIQNDTIRIYYNLLSGVYVVVMKVISF